MISFESEFKPLSGHPWDKFRPSTPWNACLQAITNPALNLQPLTTKILQTDRLVNETQTNHLMINNIYCILFQQQIKPSYK